MQVMGRSGIKPPTQVPQFGKLHELSASENNVRTAMPPPAVTNGQKHTIGGCKERSKKLNTQSNLTTMIVPESANKQRKITNQQSQPSSRLVNSVKGSSLATLSNKQSSTSTNLSRQPSTSKTSSNHAFSYSASGSSRPTSLLAQSRPESAMGHTRANSVHAAGRSATAMGYRGGIQNAQADAPQKSTTPSFSPNRTLHLRKLRSCNGRKISQVTPSKSLSTSVSSESSSTSQSAHRRSCSQPPIHPVSLQEAAGADRDEFRVTSLTQALDQMIIGSECAPPQTSKVSEDEARLRKTPNFASRIPTATPAKQISSHTPPETPTNLTFRPPILKSPSKPPTLAPAPVKHPQFLSKDSNLLAPVPWDGSTLATKMENMEKVFQSFKTQMEGTTFERSHMKEAVALFQARGESSLFRSLMTLETNEILQWWNWKRYEISST